MMNLPKRYCPPRLGNCSNVCSANCIMQVLFNDSSCWEMIVQLNDDDPLKRIATRFTTVINGSRSIYLNDLYEIFPPIIEAKNEEKINHPDEEIESIQLDPIHIFEKILNNYPFIKEYFQNSEESFNYTQSISIQDDCESIQSGLNQRINLNIGEFTFAPKCLSINITRIKTMCNKIAGKIINTSYLSKKPINPNKYIHYAPIGTEIDEYYTLYAMILHHNSEINQGHFEVLLFIDDDFYQCNDTHVSNFLRKEISDATLKKKSYILFYKKLDEKPLDYDDQIIISPPRRTTNDSISESIESIENESSESNQFRRTYSQNSSNVFPVTALNKKTIPLFIPYNSKAEGLEIPEEISIDDSILHLYRLVDKTDSNSIKFDIHQSFKYLNGFLDVAPGEAPNIEYSVSKPIYQYSQNLLEVFIDIICNFVYNSDSTSNGEINSNLTANKLNIDIDSPMELQVKEIGDVLFNLFKDYENKKPKIEKQKIENDIISFLLDMIKYEIDEDGNIIAEHKRDNLHEVSDHEFPDQNYDWKSRINEYGIDKILEEMQRLKFKEKNSSQSSNNSDKLREKLWKDFLEKKSRIKSKKDFINGWVKDRAAAVKEGAKFISEKRAYQLLNESLKKGGVIQIKKQSGAPTKFSDEARLCLLATVMDFPTLTDEQRTNYLNEFGPCQTNKVSVRLVNKELGKLNITVKKPCFSDPQRNSIGFRIARYIWSRFMLDVTEQRNALFVFIDEAGVQRSQPNTSRGFVSVRPLTEGTTKSNNIASILAAVVPGYGSISRWYKGSVSNQEYSIFLREISYILRTRICNQSTQIITIQDNASIHKTKEVREMALKCNLNLFYIVPYSPHLNEVAENYFGQMKYACIFDHEFACRDDCDGINGTTKYQFLDEEELMYRWNEMTKQKYSGISALSIFQGWISILKECTEGKPLTGQRFIRSEIPNSQMNNIQCYRKNIFSFR